VSAVCRSLFDRDRVFCATNELTFVLIRLIPGYPFSLEVDILDVSREWSRASVCCCPSARLDHRNRSGPTLGRTPVTLSDRHRTSVTFGKSPDGPRMTAGQLESCTRSSRFSMPDDSPTRAARSRAVSGVSSLRTRNHRTWLRRSDQFDEMPSRDRVVGDSWAFLAILWLAAVSSLSSFVVLESMNPFLASLPRKGRPGRRIRFPVMASTL